MGQADGQVNCDRDSLYGSIVHVDTTYTYINPPSSGRQCHKYKGSVSKHVQTPKITWRGLSCNWLSFCTHSGGQQLEYT